MLAHVYDPERVIFPAYIQPKIDGIRAIFSHEEGKFYTRNKKEIVVPSGLISNFVNFPGNLDGELIIPGKSFNSLSGSIRNLNMIPDKDNIRYIIFDCFRQEPFWERFSLMRDLLTPNSWFSILDTFTVYNHQGIKAFYEGFLSQGYEGAIVRNNTSYEFKRSYNLLKIKPTKEVEALIIGMTEGTGKYEGTLGALTVKTQENKTFNVGTGFNDCERDWFWNQLPEKIENLRIKVSFQDYSEYGIPRHPSYKGIIS